MELLFHRRTPSVSSWRFTPEPRRAAEEGLSDEELALFDLLLKDNISKSDQEKLTQASRGVLASLQRRCSRPCRPGRTTPRRRLK